jgi:hypothetical protein
LSHVSDTRQQNIILIKAAQVEQELGELLDVLPDLTVRLERIKATLLMRLLQHKDKVAENLVALRKALPGVDAGDLVMRYPALLTDMDNASIAAQVQALQCAATWSFTNCAS